LFGRWFDGFGGVNLNNGRWRFAQLTQYFGLHGKEANAGRSQGEQMLFSRGEDALKITHGPDILIRPNFGARQCC
jgi:hypothetical protein